MRSSATAPSAAASWPALRRPSTSAGVGSRADVDGPARPVHDDGVDEGTGSTYAPIRMRGSIIASAISDSSVPTMVRNE